MRPLTVDLFVSLDGFASADAPAYFGYDGPELDAWVQREIEQPQFVLMGRVTYEALAGFASHEATPSKLTAIPKLVVSSRLAEPLAWESSSLLRGDLEPGIRALKEQPGPPIRTMGSMSLAASLLEIGLVDRLRLMVFPLTVAGRGRERAFATWPTVDLELVEHVELDSRLVLLEYRPRRNL